MPNTITSQCDGALLRIHLNRPELHNAFNAEMIAELTATLREADDDAGVRAVILSGNGKSFSAGADLNWMRGMAAFSEAENRDDSMRLAELMRTLDGLSRPTIARVNGAAFGGGVGLIACCDIAIGVDTALFGLTEVRLGLVPAVISPYVVAAIGARQSRHLFLTGERFDAATAARIGLLHETVNADQLDQRVNAIASDLACGGPDALSEAKRLVARIAAGHDDEATTDRQNAALIARLRVSDEGQEGLTAFFERRNPRWLAEADPS
ncbi:MAG: enoyl-CoA hydratase/isomerase family protein [Xanthomonadales bacterium]|nr:enoyl-CoA hydratase/isomerase family protein [Xanthomonadales bacterium]